MDRILYTAMSGARQSMDQQSVVSNNLANASTTGFRGQMQALRAVPVQGDGALATPHLGDGVHAGRRFQRRAHERHRP